MFRFALYLCLVAGTAHASPPNAVNISDVYLGASADQVFLLRSIDDNLGRYYPAALDIYLVARSRRGNAPDEVWPIRRKIDYSASANEPDENIVIPSSIDPFAIIAQREAWPWAMSHTQGLPQISYENGIITAVATSLEGWEQTPLQTQFRMPLETAIRQFVDSHNATRASLEQHPGMNGGSDSIYYFYEDTFSQECTPMSGGYLRGGNDQIDTLLVEFSCSHPEERYIHARVFLVIPKTPQS